MCVEREAALTHTLLLMSDEEQVDYGADSDAEAGGVEGVKQPTAEGNSGGEKRNAGG